MCLSRLCFCLPNISLCGFSTGKPVKLYLLHPRKVTWTPNNNWWFVDVFSFCFLREAFSCPSLSFLMRCSHIKWFPMSSVISRKSPMNCFVFQQLVGPISKKKVPIYDQWLRDCNFQRVDSMILAWLQLFPFRTKACCTYNRKYDEALSMAIEKTGRIKPGKLYIEPKSMPKKVEPSVACGATGILTCANVIGVHSTTW